MNTKTIDEAALLRKNYDQATPTADMLLRRMQEELRGRLRELEVNGHVKGRIKKFESFFEKVHRNQRDGEANPITDFMALRILCPFSEDVARVEKCLMDAYTVRETIHKGSERSFREFGYDSVHLVIELPWPYTATVPLPGCEWVFEIQIRTILQDAWAEVEHELIYKGDSSMPDESVRRKLAAINAALSLADTIFQELREQLRDLKIKEEKRRSLVQEKAHLMDQDHMTRTLQRSLIEHPEYMANAGTKERIEKFLMFALQCHSQEEYQQAVTLYGKALELGPEPRIQSIIHNHRGMAWFIMSNFENAFADFSSAIENNQQNFRAFNNRAQCHRLQGNIQNAIEDYNTSLSVKKDQQDTLVLLAECYFDIDNYVEAIRLLDNALSLNQQHKKALELRKKVLRKMIN